jgi:hypothetical protein
VVRIYVQDVWKGTLPDVVTIYTGLWDGDCGYNFEIDIEYLVFAYDIGTKVAQLGTGLCSRTALLEGNPDVAELGAPVTPTLPTSWGMIKRTWR